jgi:hypothetical protein
MANVNSLGETLLNFIQNGFPGYDKNFYPGIPRSEVIAFLKLIGYNIG